MKIWDKLQSYRAKNKADRETREIEQAEQGLIAAKREEEVESKKLALAEEREKVSKLKSERFSHSTVGRAVSSIKTAMTAQRTPQNNTKPQPRSGLFGGAMGQGGMGGGFSGFGMGSPPRENYSQHRISSPLTRKIKQKSQPREVIDWGWGMNNNKTKKHSPLKFQW